MQVETFKSQNEIDSGKFVSVKLAVKLTEQEISQAPAGNILLILLLDISGSMKGERIAALKAAIMYILERCAPGVHLAMIAFNTVARDMIGGVLTLGDAPAAQLAPIRELVADLDADGSTNIGEALEMAYGICENFKSTEFIAAHILLLTDGMNNSGPGDKEIINLVQKTFISDTRHPPIHTFALGRDPNANFLTAISRLTAGHYYCIQAAEIAASFGACIGGLLNTKTNMIEMDIICSDGCRLVKIMSGLPFSEIVKNKHYKIFLGSLQYRASKTLLVKLSLKGAPDGTQKILDYSISYNDQKRIAGEEFIKRCTNPEAELPQIEIARAEMQFNALIDIFNILHAADSNDYVRAQELAAEATSRYTDLYGSMPDENDSAVSFAAQTINNFSTLMDTIRDEETYTRGRHQAAEYSLKYVHGQLELTDAQKAESHMARDLSSRYMDF